VVVGTGMGHSEASQGKKRNVGEMHCLSGGLEIECCKNKCFRGLISQFGTEKLRAFISSFSVADHARRSLSISTASESSLLSSAR
jgi:hypothetical protein